MNLIIGTFQCLLAVWSFFFITMRLLPDKWLLISISDGLPAHWWSLPTLFTLSAIHTTLLLRGIYNINEAVKEIGKDDAPPEDLE